MILIIEYFLLNYFHFYQFDFFEIIILDFVGHLFVLIVQYYFHIFLLIEFFHFLLFQLYLINFHFLFQLLNMFLIILNVLNLNYNNHVLIVRILFQHILNDFLHHLNKDQIFIVELIGFEFVRILKS